MGVPHGKIPDTEFCRASHIGLHLRAFATNRFESCTLGIRSPHAYRRREWGDHGSARWVIPLLSFSYGMRAGRHSCSQTPSTCPAPIMKDYIAVWSECETTLRDSGLPATILRPWYILGPGHWCPLMLKPAYWLCEQLPSTSESAARLGLATSQRMLASLAWAVEHPAGACQND